MQRQFHQYLALAVARRRGLDHPDELALMAAAIAQTVIILAFDQWADADGENDLEKLLSRKFDLAEQVVSAQTSTAERGRAARGPRKPRS
jgi:hypothetical protein